MPIKFKESVKVLVDRQSKKFKTVNYYMHTTSTDTLLEAFGRDQTKPKHKQKIKNELVRRKVSML